MPGILLATTVAMVAFAANSLLARLALADGAIDAASYTVVRLVSGALALGLFLVLQRRTSLRDLPGNWISAAALAAYALAFSFAYLDLGAATGALILFASVQATMIAWSIARGDWPTSVQWAGLAVAFAAFVYLLLPGIGMPNPRGAALPAAAPGRRGRGACQRRRAVAGGRVGRGGLRAGLRGLVPRAAPARLDAGGDRAALGARHRGRRGHPVPVRAADGALRRGRHARARGRRLRHRGATAKAGRLKVCRRGRVVGERRFRR